jgi:microcystin-dependent protein
MANLTESASWEAGIYQLETSDPVQGGASGVSNQQAKQLANRTKYLKQVHETLGQAVGDGSALGNASVARTKIANGVISAAVRNCVQTGPQGSAGEPTHVSGANASSTVTINGSPTPIRLSFAAGFDVKGPVDYHGEITTDSTVNVGSIAGTSAVYIYAKRITDGTITTHASVGPFINSRVEPDLADRKFWYNPSTSRWLEWTTDFGGSWATIQLVIMARVTRNQGSNVNEVYPYQYNESNETDSLVPAGTVVAMHCDPSAIPMGWLAANGAYVSRTTYAKLYERLGTSYGSATGQFKLPDLRGEFIRGLDAGRGVDASRVLGSAQAAIVGSHKHNAPIHIAANGDIHVTDALPFGSGDSFAATDKNTGGTTQSGTVAYALTSDPHASSNTGSGDNRPRNIALLYLIKY